MNEAEVRTALDKDLRDRGWVLDAASPNQDVYVERAVKSRLSTTAQKQLGSRAPDYTLFVDRQPVAVIEAKKGMDTLESALEQGTDYASRIGAPFVFAYNKMLFKSLHISANEPLKFNNMELDTVPTPGLLREFIRSNSPCVQTLSQHVVQSREELVTIFTKMNDLLRADGIIDGLPRFTEFANILFLKLLSEGRDADPSVSSATIWTDLLKKKSEELKPYINGFVIGQLKGQYGSDLLSETKIKSADKLKEIILELNTLSLSSVDEDLKGMAFEHFLRGTTSTNTDLGQYFTPRHIVRFLVKLADPEFNRTVFDPFCGTGGFLIEAFKHLYTKAGRAQTNQTILREQTLFGQEITETSRIAKMNMILFRDGHSGIVEDDSLLRCAENEHDYVFSNIPFNLKRAYHEIRAADPDARDADEACLLRCFNSLKTGGSMAVVVPDGLVVNMSHIDMWRRLFQNSRVRVIAKLPRGCFAPYTDSATRVVYLTDKGRERTEWFYSVTIDDDGVTELKDGTSLKSTNDLENFLFFYDDSNIREERVNLRTVSIVDVGDLDDEGSLRDAISGLTGSTWPILTGIETVPLAEVADMCNGKAITERHIYAQAANLKKAESLDVPVIAGGRSSPYSHFRHNHVGPLITVSKTGAFSGYIWWHSGRIWASDCFVVKSKDEQKFLTAYIYGCLKSQQEEIYERQQGTGQPHIYIKHLEKMPIPVVPIKKQEALVKDFLSALKAKEEADRAFDSAHSDLLKRARDQRSST